MPTNNQLSKPNVFFRMLNSVKSSINIIRINAIKDPNSIPKFFEGLDVMQQDSLFSYVIKKYENEIGKCFLKLDKNLALDRSQELISIIQSWEPNYNIVMGGIFGKGYDYKAYIYNEVTQKISSSFIELKADEKRRYIDIVLSDIITMWSAETNLSYRKLDEALSNLYSRLTEEEKKEFFVKFLECAKYRRTKDEGGTKDLFAMALGEIDEEIDSHIYSPVDYLKKLGEYSNSEIIYLNYSKILNKLNPSERLKFFGDYYNKLDDDKKDELLDYTIQMIDSAEVDIKNKHHSYYILYSIMNSKKKIERIEQFLNKYPENYDESVFKEYIRQFSSLEGEKKKEAYQKIFNFIENFDMSQKSKADAYIALYESLSSSEKINQFDVYAKKMEGDASLIAKVFSILPKENMADVFQTSILNAENNEEIIGCIMSNMKPNDVFEIFRDISLSDDLIKRVITKYPQVSVKMMAFDKEIDIEKIMDLSEYEQFDNGIININSIVNTLFLNKSLSKKEINQKISDVYALFTYNNLPEFIKTFRIFQLTESVHNVSNSDIESFKDKTFEERDLIILQELFVLSLNSNNQSLRKFFNILDSGKKISGNLDGRHPYENIKKLDSQDYAILCQYRDTLFELHNLIREIHGCDREHLDVSDDVIADLNKIVTCYSKRKDASATKSNFVVSTSLILDELLGNFTDSRITPRAVIEYMDRVEEESRTRHAKISDEIKAGTIRLEPGDWVKGIESFSEYFPILIRTSLKAGEFNQNHSHSDITKMDCDFGYISDGNVQRKKSDYEILESSISSAYGKTWLVLKNYDERIKQRAESEFGDSGVLHYIPDYYSLKTEGNYQDRYARVGIPVTDIDYIVTKEWQEGFGYEMAMAGLFIPVKDIDDNVVFTREDYDAIREKMAGLSEFGMEEFDVDEKAIDMNPLFETYRKISQKESSIVDDEISKVSQLILGDDDEVTKRKKGSVLDFVIEFFKSKGIITVDNLSQNQSKKSVELIDIGSTGRGTNIPGDGDFDFFLRHNLSSEILSEFQEYVERYTSTAGDGSFISLEDGFRAKNVQLPSGEIVDIDVTHGRKNLNLEYTSDLCVRDRLESIKTQSPAEYNYVIANIIMAKKILKSVGLYKKARSDGATEFGGFGGIGVENWVLQNGGSFAQAIDTFLEAAKSVNSHEEFIKKYPIFDFGCNHRGNMYFHDRFSAFLEGKGEDHDYGFNEAIKRFTEIQKMIREEQAKPHVVSKPEPPAVNREEIKSFVSRRGFSFAQGVSFQSKRQSMESDPGKETQ